MKIYICGSVGSGKSTIARRVTDQMNIPNYSLDDVTWTFDNHRRSEQERIRRVNEICKQKDWIIEGAQLGWIDRTEVLSSANIVIAVEPRPVIVWWRINFRYIKQILKLEKSRYRPSLGLLHQMQQWRVNYYQNDRKRLRALAQQYNQQVVVCHSFSDVMMAVTEKANG